MLLKKNLLMSILFQGPIYIKWTGTRKSEANQKLSTKIKSGSKVIHGAKRKRIKAIYGAPVQEKYAMAVRFNVTVDYLQNRKRFVDDTFRFVLPDKIGYNESG